MRRAGALVAAAIFLAVLVAFTVVAVVPYFTKKRDYPAAITSPMPLVTTAIDVVKPGQRLCTSGITIEQHSDVARFEIGTYSKPGPPVDVTIDGPGYSLRRRIAGGYADNLVHQLPVTPAAHPLLARICFRNAGRTKMTLYAADDVARSRAGVTIDGHTLIATPAIGFWEARPVSIWNRLAVTVKRMTFFRGPLGYTALIWVVLVLTALGLTAGIAAVLVRGFSGSDARN